MSSSKIYKQRTYLDPIHGPIQLNLGNPVENLLVKIIDTKEFQRLRRIRQMGTGWFTFHGAEHSRFGHSLGSMFIAIKILDHLIRSNNKITKYTPEILVSALIHDIGHGPFSHTAEKFTSVPHEEWTKRIISGDTEINRLLKSFDKKLPDGVIKLFEYKDFPLYVSQIISSYIDCDRLDYLHRDSYYVGVPYGLTGSARIIASLGIDEESNKLIVNESVGLDAVIHYLHARYSMYQQVYQHRKNLSSDFLLRKIVERIKHVNPKTLPVPLSEWLNFEERSIYKISPDSFFQVDDYLLMTTIQTFVFNKEEKILSDLSNRFIARQLFKSLEFRHEVKNEKIKDLLSELKKKAKNLGMEPEFYVGIEESSSKPYEPYQADKGKSSKAIYVKQKNGGVKELTKVSALVKALSEENVVKTCLIYAPELNDEIKNIKGIKELFK